MSRLALVGVLGAAGALARLGLSNLVGVRSFPWATLLINVTGSFALGLVITWLGPKLSPALASGVGIGFLGAFTTYSTFAVEASLLGDEQRLVAATAYVAASVVLGLAAAAAGIGLGRSLAHA